MGSSCATTSGYRKPAFSAEEPRNFDDLSKDLKPTLLPDLQVNNDLCYATSQSLEALASSGNNVVHFSGIEVDSLNRELRTSDGPLKTLEIAQALIQSQPKSSLIQNSNKIYAYGLEIIVSKMNESENIEIGNLLALGIRASKGELSDGDVEKNFKMVRAMAFLLRTAKARTSEQAWRIVHPENKLPGQNSLLYEPEAILAGFTEMPQLNPEALKNYLKQLEIVDSDVHAEHDVYHDVKSGVTIKLTKTSKLSQDKNKYLQRLVVGNQVFGDQIRVAGFVSESFQQGDQIVVVQPWIEGRPSTQAEIDKYMQLHGFKKAVDGIYGGGSRSFWVSDVVPKNVRTDSAGVVHIIDFLLPELSPSAEEYYQNIIDGSMRSPL
jgi:hypothetical protein